MNSDSCSAAAPLDGGEGPDGIPLLRTLATALLQLDEATDLHSFTLPYPSAVQHAVDRVALACLLGDLPPPVGVTELVQWCQELPLAEWPLNLPDDLTGPNDRLLDEESARPTELCHEWAERSGDAAVLSRERAVWQWAFRLCREYGEEDSYTAFRDLLVNEPVLTSADMFAVAGRLLLEPVHSVVETVYAPVPDSYLHHGEYVTCGRCLTLLTPARDGGWWCERDRCRRQGPPVEGRRLKRAECGTVYQLERPLRQFVTGPGRAEVELARRLTALGLTVRMWPGFDAYDLLVTFPDGLRWAVDVKDWANPWFLGRSARPVPPEPPHDEAFWVVPEHRVAARRGYVSTFEKARPAAVSDLRLFTDSELVARARTRLRTPKGDARA